MALPAARATAVSYVQGGRWAALWGGAHGFGELVAPGTLMAARSGVDATLPSACAGRATA